MSNVERPHLLLVNLGTPREATPAAVREFLEEFLSDPQVVDFPGWFWRPILKTMVLRKRPERVAHAYASIWREDGSPLRSATERMVDAVRARAPESLSVSAAYRYGAPSIDAEMQRLAREHAGPIVVVPLFPHRTSSTTGTAFLEARAAADRAGIRHRLREQAIPAADPHYISALAARWLEALDEEKREPEHLVISFHGIPKRYDARERRQYSTDCRATAEALLAAIGWPADRATVAFQSKFGPEPWLTPATADVINALPRRGIRSVGVITPGFLTEGLETLEEIGIRAREEFEANGGHRFFLAQAVEEHHAMVASLVRLALSHATSGSEAERAPAQAATASPRGAFGRTRVRRPEAIAFHDATPLE